MSLVTTSPGDSLEQVQLFFEWQAQIRGCIDFSTDPLDEGQAIDCVLEELGRILHADRVALIQLKNNHALPVFHEYLPNTEKIAPFKGQLPPWDTCPFLKITACQGFAYTEDATQDMDVPDTLREIFLRAGIRAGVGCPVVHQNQLLSVLVVHQSSPRQWQSHELSLIMTAADQIALAQVIGSKQRSKTELEDQFFPLFQHAAVGFAKVGLDCRWLSVNRKLCEITGYSEQELLSMTFKDITHPDDLEADLTNMRKVMAKELDINTMEKRYIRKDGSVVWIHLTATLVRDENDLPDYFVVVIQDISLRKAALEALQLSEAHLAAVFNQAGVGIGIVTPDGRFVKANAKFCDITGYSSSELIQKTLHELTHPDDREMNQDRVERMFRSEVDSYEQEKRYIRKDGASVWVKMSCSSIKDANGNTIFGIGIAEDITEQKKFSTALKESEERFRTLANNAPMLIFLLDADLKTLYRNQTLLYFLGLDNHPEPCSIPITNFIHPDDLTLFNEKVALMKSGQPHNCEIRIRRYDGEYRWVFYETVPNRDFQGQLQGFIGVAIDITDRKQAEQILKESHARYQALDEAMRFGIWVCNSEGEATYASDSFLKLIGQTWDECKQLGWTDKLPPEDVPAMLKQWRHSLKTGEKFEYEHWFLGTDGQRHPIWASGVPIKDEQGNIKEWIGINLDISKLKQTEQALRESEERWRHLASSLPAFVWATTAMGESTYINDHWFDYTGMSKEQAAGYGWSQAIHPEDFSRCAAAREVAVHNKTPYNVELRYRRHDGEYRWYATQAKPILDEHGEIVEWFGTSVDIHELKVLETALRGSEKRWKQLANAIPSFVWRGLPDGSIEFLNEQWYKYTGLSEEESLGAHWLQAVHPDDLEPAQRIRQQARQHGASYEIELRYRRHDGEYRWYLAQGEPIFDEDQQLIAWYGVSSDIHERKTLESALRESEKKYRNVVEGTNEGYWYWDIDEDFVFWSDRMFEIYGQSKEQFTPSTENFFQLVHPDDRPMIEVKLTDHLAGKCGFDFEFRAVKPSGEVVYLHNQAKAEWNEIGQAVRIAGMTTDITERKKAETALKQSLARENLSRRIIQDISQSRDIDFILNRTASQLAEFLEADRCLITRYSVENNQLNLILSAQHCAPDIQPLLPEDINSILKAARKLSPEAIEKNQSPLVSIINQEDLVAFVKNRMKQVDLPGVDTDELIRLTQKYQISAMLRAQIEYQGIFYGTLGLQQCTPRVWQDSELELVKTLVKSLGSALYQAELFKREEQARKEVLQLNQDLEKRVAERTAELQKNTNLLHSIIENVPSMIFMKDARDLRFLLFNKAAEEIVGYSREELLGKNDYDFFPKEQADFFTQKDRQTLESKTLLDISEEPIITKYGEVRILHTKKVPILNDEGQSQYLIGVSEDITDAKKDKERIEALNQQLAQQVHALNVVNKELESFSYSVSHDLRAPLRTIEGFSQAVMSLYETQLDDKGRDYLMRIRSGSQHMAKLIDDMLNLSRLTRGELNIQPNINLSQIVLAASRELQAQEPERQVQFDIEDNIIVSGDKRLLGVVVQNLLENAWKYTSKHPTACIVFGKMTDSETGLETYYVQDDGAGFDMTYAGKLFGAFQRLHSVSEFPGNGIGLATVARIIHRHGGDVWASGEPEEGATFYFTLCPASTPLHLTEEKKIGRTPNLSV